MKNNIIYKAVSPSNKVYIGQTTKGLRYRKTIHITVSKNPNNASYNTPFCKALRKYGANNFNWIILYDNIPKSKLDDMEIQTIANYNSYHGKGYNSTSGGKSCMHSDETKKKMSETRRGKNNPMYGKKHSKETKKLISKIRSKLTDEQKTEIRKNYFLYGGIFKKIGEQYGVCLTVI
ncbi:hypothetical protein LCGC14_2223260, partial [marine sediment metagenome]